MRPTGSSSDAEKVFALSDGQFQAAFKRICERAGIENLHVHDLRHTATTQICLAFREAGTPLGIHELAQITGHRDLRMVLRYTHLMAGEMATRMDAAFAKAAAAKRLKKGRIRPSRTDLIIGAPGGMVDAHPAPPLDLPDPRPESTVIWPDVYAWKRRNQTKQTTSE